MKYFLSGLVALVYFLFPITTFAQENWVINTYSSDIRIQSTGELYVTENITVDFYSLEKHGIFRFIPYVYEDPQSGEKTYTEVEIEEVLQDSEVAESDVYREDYNVVIKIGDPNKTISGKHSYTITYRVKGVLRGFEDYDELYWNVIGPYWEVPIEKAEAKVTLAQDGITKADCFVGSLGSTFHCSSQIDTPTRAVFQTERQLNPYEAFTVVVGYEKGIVPLLKVERPKTFIERFFEWPSLLTFAFVFLLGIVSAFFVWFRFGRDFWTKNPLTRNIHEKGSVKPIGGHETIVVEYTPPEKLPPAVLGVLVDEKAHTHDVTATIIDLATRGYLSITEVPKKWMFGSVDYQLKLEKDTFKNLFSYEKLLLTELFDDGDTVTVSSLKKSFYTSLKKVKDELYTEVAKRNLFLSNPDSIRTKYFLIAFFILFAGVGLFIFSITLDNIFLADIALGGAFCGLCFVIISSFMPRRSAYGRDLYRRVRGYELFIGNVEKHRQKFFESKNMFNEVLPYAIVFGLTKKFARAMDEMGVKPSQTTTGWYHGVTPLNTALLASHINDFSNSVGTAIASTPSSSSGFSGGSSGGGFGGGGGGSW